MKKPIIIAVAVVVVVILCLSLFNTGKNDKPNGSYSATMGGKTFATLTFSGNKVTYEGSSRTTKGSFTMDGNTVIINYDNGNSDELVYDPEEDTLNFGGMIFKK